ncbi:hypothetical protein DFP72DRAFT_843837 [Ephemerocybe angulata]|uniref:Uncharacterized protein n=1 Tax=Ephemerocybe angulata TaxID=980116 RepID=A0A8H6MBC9_9AGAR|nr:hypothetical protein DFP72DRAFT_843837 [Tulosesus angulatus]
MAYLGAVAHQQEVAFDFENGELTFVTRKRESTATFVNGKDKEDQVSVNDTLNSNIERNGPAASPFPLLQANQGPTVYHLIASEGADNIRYLRNFDFPVALPYETEVPVFDARNPQLAFTDIVWDSLSSLPQLPGEVPMDSIITVGFTALLSSREDGKPEYLTLPLQFVVVHHLLKGAQEQAL